MRPVLLRIPMEQVGAAIGRPRLPLLTKGGAPAPVRCTMVLGKIESDLIRPTGAFPRGRLGYGFAGLQ